LQRLIALQREVTASTLAELVGTEVEVLVEGPSRTEPTRLTGHTTENRMVNFAGDAPTGALATVRVVASSASSLVGVQTSQSLSAALAPPRASAGRRLPVLA
jgi:tRNA-2-methylthio-N6-dimethylallyladenosine synthase